MYIDSHCHLSFPELKSQLPDLLAAMDAADVRQAICICTQMEEFETVHGLALAHPQLWATVGVHPDNDDVLEPSLDDLLLKDLPAICDLTGPDRPIVLVGWGYAGAIAYAAAAEGSPLKQRIVGVVSLGGVVELDAPPNAHLAKLWEGKQPVDLSLAMQRRVPGRTESLFELLWVHGSSLDTQSKQDFRAHGLSVISSNQIAQLRSWAASGKTTLGGRPYPEQLRTLKVPVWELDGMLDAWSHPEAASAVRDYVPRELLEARAATRFVGFAEDPSHLGLVQGKVAEQEILPMLLSFRDKLERLRREGAP